MQLSGRAGLFHLITGSAGSLDLVVKEGKNMDSPEEQAVESIRKELHRLYREALGKEPDPEVLWAEAEDFVARYGPDTGLKELF
jgi:hypothetical protein